MEDVSASQALSGRNDEDLLLGAETRGVQQKRCCARRTLLQLGALVFAVAFLSGVVFMHSRPGKQYVGGGAVDGVLGLRGHVPHHITHPHSHPHDPGHVSLYCFAVMYPLGPERELLETAAKLHEGIFGCDEWSIFSTIKGKVWGTQITFLQGINMTVPQKPTPREFGGDGVTLSSANAPVFKTVWDVILKEGHYKNHDWTVKLDPDAVLLPKRLRSSLSSPWHRQGASTANGAYVVNCVYGLYGSIEIVSRNALTVMATNQWKCPSPYVVAQEDVWLRICLRDMGVWGQNNYGGFCMDLCDEPSNIMIRQSGRWALPGVCPEPFYTCQGLHAAFHPFKTPDAIKQCFENANSYAHSLGLE